MSKIETGLHYPIHLDKLPGSWGVGYVGDFATEIQPGFASGEHNQEGTGIPHIRPMNIDRQGKIDLNVVKYVLPDTDTKRLRLGDVLFNNTNSPELIGKTTVVTQSGDWGFSNHMTRIVFREGMDSKYAAYQLHYLWMRGYFLYNCVKHVNQASVSSKTLAKAVPFVVAPTDQQKRIVAEIEKQFSRLDEAVVNLKRVKANLKRYKASVLKAAVEGKLTEEWRKAHPDVEPASKLLKRILTDRRAKWNGRGKYKEPAEPDTSILPPLPRGWAWATVQQLAHVQLGKMLDRQKHRSGEELPYLRNINVRWGSIDTDDLLEMFFKDGELDRYGLKRGDVLVCEGGEPGRASVWDGRVPGMKYQKALHRVRFLTGYEGKFLVFLLEFLAKSGRLERWFTGSTIKHFTGESIAVLPVPVPPIAEQRRIVAEVDRRFSIVEELEKEVTANLQRAERLRQAILHEAFTGRFLTPTLCGQKGQTRGTRYVELA